MPPRPTTSTSKKADLSKALVFESRHPKLAIALHPGTQAPGYSGRERAPFELCLLSIDGSRFSILEAFDEESHGGSVLYKQEMGSRPIEELPGRKVLELDVDPMFGAFGGMMFELTSRRSKEFRSYC